MPACHKAGIFYLLMSAFFEWHNFRNIQQRIFKIN